MKFRKQEPKYLDDLHILFGMQHVSRSSRFCFEDISFDEASDEVIDEVTKFLNNDVVNLASLKLVNLRKRKCKGSFNSVDEKDEKSPFFLYYINTCLKIETIT